MLPRPTAVVECSSCGLFLENLPPAGAGSLGFQVFTDGFTEIGSSFSRPGFCVCPGCDYLEDFHDLRKVGQRGQAWTWIGQLSCTLGSRRNLAYKWSRFWRLDPPQIPRPAHSGDFLDPLAIGVANRDRERRLRIGLWQTWGQSQEISPNAPEYQENLSRLLQLCDPSRPLERLTMAEAYRQLGLCSEGLQVLYPPLPEEALPRGRVILALLRIGNRALKRVEGNLHTAVPADTDLPWEGGIPAELYSDRFP